MRRCPANAIVGSGVRTTEASLGALDALEVGIVPDAPRRQAPGVDPPPPSEPDRLERQRRPDRRTGGGVRDRPPVLVGTETAVADEVVNRSGG